MIKILKIIYSILIADSAITAVVNNKIFPNVVPDFDNSDNIDYPLIVMRRLSVDPAQTKCKNQNSDKATIEILCYANSYEDVVDLAQLVRNSLEFYKSGTISNLRFISISEDFTEGVYYQNLTFNIN